MAYGNKAYDVTEGLEVGDVGFVVEHENHRTHQRWKTISATPEETNLSHRILLKGWVGTMNDVRAEAAGVARVVDVGYDWRGAIRARRACGSPPSCTRGPS